MKKAILETKGYFEGNEFKVTHIKITKKIACHPSNKALSLKTGYVAKEGDGCNCPDDTPQGRYECVGKNCIFVPFI